MENEHSKMSQDDLVIKILDFVCKNKDKNGISPELIQSDLFPDLTVDDIRDLFDVISHKRISQITVVGGKYKAYLKHRIGLEDYVKKCKQLTKKQKLHRIVEFLSIESDLQKKSSFNSGQIAKAFTPELDISEVNTLCRILVSNGDVRGWSSKDISAQGLVGVSVITETRDAYRTKKYLEEEFNMPINQNIVTVDNIIVGDNYGSITQKDNFPTIKSSRKLKWWEIVVIIITALAGIATILSLIFGII